LAIETPEKVGIDRLLNAFAAHQLVKPMPAIVFSLGTAITADLVDEHGVFHGGAIAPGARLMAKALNDYTAKLPLIDNPKLLDVTCPGKNTDQAIRLGIAFSVIGMLHGLSSMLASLCGPLPAFVFTGGDMELLTDAKGNRWSLDPERTHYVPTLTLDGILAVSHRINSE
jgi:type III pantothenate kinase